MSSRAISPLRGSSICLSDSHVLAENANADPNMPTNSNKISCIAASRVLPRVSIEKRYKLNVRLLGEGSNGAVSVAQNIFTEQEVAVKFLPLSDELATNTGISDQTHEANSLNEMKILLQLDHPNICKLLEIYEDPENVKLVMENCSGGDLYSAYVFHCHHFLRCGKRILIRSFAYVYDFVSIQNRLAEKFCYSANVTKRLARQMFDAISYCHSHGICHRDLKLENWVYSDATRTQIKLDKLYIHLRFCTYTC